MKDEQYPANLGDPARAAAWEVDRRIEAAPLPFAHERHYANESHRQIDLYAAGRGNIAKAAGELGLTTTEWHELRAKLGKSPSRGDVQPQR
ncbi:MAG TPA: hypothetical protein VFP35_04360 [Candidatus Saccharimonadales bacterium]|nr:hypothetical protein [Candidatus Saccharimonadales bacterium]